MKDMTMPIGALRHRLVLEKDRKTDDGAGGLAVETADAGTVWGRIRPLRPPRGGWVGSAPRCTHEIVLRSSAATEDISAFRDGGRRFRVLARSLDESGRWQIFQTEIMP